MSTKSHTGIKTDLIKAMVDSLNKLLANEQILYTKTRNYHWNVEGAEFMSIHLMFESQYNELADNIDPIAERIKKIEGFAIGSMKEYLALTSLKENESKHLSSMEMIADLVRDHQSLVEELKNDVIPLSEESNDVGSNDYLTGLLGMHETMAWKLRAHLGK